MYIYIMYILYIL